MNLCSIASIPSFIGCHISFPNCRFTPEQIGIQASTALVWVIIELIATLLSLYIMNLNADLKYTDCLAYSGYKFVG